MSYSLGIDASTQSISALIIDLDSGEFVCENSINFDEKLPEFNTVNGVIEGNTDGEVFSNPLMWLNALELLFEDISKKCDVKKIKAISGAGQQHGSVYLNANWLKNINKLKSNISLSEQIRPCLSRLEAPIWMDTSTKIECEEISNAIGGKDNVCRKSGSISIERFTGPQIRRFYKTSPDSYLQTKRIHLVSSFICSILSGKDCPIDTGDGAGMNLLNIDNFKFTIIKTLPFIIILYLAASHELIGQYWLNKNFNFELVGRSVLLHRIASLTVLGLAAMNLVAYSSFNKIDINYFDKKSSKEYLKILLISLFFSIIVTFFLFLTHNNL